LSDDNTQALFAPAQQTCTEAFFEQIHGNEDEQMVVDNVNPVRNMTVSLLAFIFLSNNFSSFIQF
jgi:F0F1-type ATP synthase membrane subunit a